MENTWVGNGIGAEVAAFNLLAGQRHWFARFKRKSLVVSKSLRMVDLTMALFARFHVNGQREEIAAVF